MNVKIKITSVINSKACIGKLNIHSNIRLKEKKNTVNTDLQDMQQ